MHTIRLATVALFASLLGCPVAPEPERQWSVAKDGLDRIPLCVWGAGAGDVWIGGGGLGTGAGQLLLRADVSGALREIPTGRAESLWWIHGAAANDVWLVGEQGLAMHWDGSAFDPRPTPTTATLYGVWASAANDAWAVGGTAGGGGPTDVLLHWDGAKWSAVDPPAKPKSAFFKVWGASAKDVHVVGDGVAMHFDGAAWKEAPLPTKTFFLTVHGGASGVYAIGGPPAALVKWNGAAWEKTAAPSAMSAAMAGVFVDASGTTFLVGEHHQRYRISSAAIADDTDRGGVTGDLHAVWADGRGNAWAVGGNYMSLATPGTKPIGVIARYR